MITLDQLRVALTEHRALTATPTADPPPTVAPTDDPVTATTGPAAATAGPTEVSATTGPVTGSPAAGGPSGQKRGDQASGDQGPGVPGIPGHAQAGGVRGAGRRPSVLVAQPADQSLPALPPLRGWETEAVLAVPTSGSTGEPKTVLLGAAALTTSAELTHARLGGPGTWLLALPTTHIAGIQVLVRSIAAGTEPGVVDLATGFRASGFATAARPVLATPGRHYTALVPTQLARLVAIDGPGLAAVREFDAVLIGGAATPPALLERSRRLGVRVVTTYGMSETSGGCVYDGLPLDGVRVRLVDGRIEISGPVLALGYQGGERFGEWFRTGDLGRIRPDGTLEVLGRADDVIISGGENIAPAQVERVLTAQAGVREACVVGLADPEWGQVVAAAVVPDDPSTPPDVGELCAAVGEVVGRSAMPKRVVFVSELPQRGPGKVDRRAVASTFG